MIEATELQNYSDSLLFSKFVFFFNILFQYFFNIKYYLSMEILSILNVPVTSDLILFYFYVPVGREK